MAVNPKRRLNDACKMAWREYLAYFTSDHLREVKVIIDDMIKDREEFF